MKWNEKREEINAYLDKQKYEKLVNNVSKYEVFGNLI